MTTPRPKPAPDPISPWLPETSPFRLATLGKLAEESSELAARAARCMIQGLDEIDPDTGRSNRTELSREIADVAACIEMVRETLSIVPSEGRITQKSDGLRHWHAMIEKEHGND